MTQTDEIHDTLEYWQGMAARGYTVITLNPEIIWKMFFAPCLTRSGLHGLKRALETNDPRLIRGKDMDPDCWFSNFPEIRGKDCKGACLASFPGWHDQELRTVGEVHDAMVDLVNKANKLAKSKFGVDPLIEWYDTARWETVRESLLKWIDESLEEENRVLSSL